MVSDCAGEGEISERREKSLKTKPLRGGTTSLRRERRELFQRKIIGGM